jgi:hypothetical protein
VKAASVPILISSASTLSGTKAAIAANTMPTIQVAKYGVACTGCTEDNRSGSRPSRDIAKITRV